MMKIYSINKIEDCFSNSKTSEINFCDDITCDFVAFLATLGEFEYHPEFPKPFFRVDIENNLTIKGVEGSNKAKVITDSKCLEDLKSKIEEIINKYNVSYAS